jgi:CheY-like chemotaxis protein
MDTVKRRILVIEGDEDVRTLYTGLCEKAVEELGQEQTVEVITATTYTAALGVLQRDPTIRIASIDLALQRNEPDQRDEEPDQEDVGGLHLLKQIQQLDLPVLSVVVTGETLQSYATDALQTYDVIRFFETSRLNRQEYQAMMLALLRYLDTADVLARIKPDTPDSYRLFLRAQEAWEQTLDYARQARAARSLPHDLGERIAALRERLLDPVTHLPASAVTEQHLKEAIIGNATGWALLQLRIRNFRELLDTRGSQIGPMMFHIANLAQEVVEQQPPPNSTVYIGMFGQNLFADPCIVILVSTNTANDRLLAPMKQMLHARFAADAVGFIDQIAQKKGISQVVPALEITEWNAAETFFADFPELVDRFFQVKVRGDDSSA